jgi:hypothetical protein
MDVTTELTAVLTTLVDEHNTMWDLGEIPVDSRIRDVDPGLVAAQYSPKFDGGVWRAGSGEEWLDGTGEAAAFLGGQGVRWELADLTILERSADEAVASYRVVHHWGDPGRPPAQAMFLETWRRSEDGRWLLVRHHAEKV